MADEIPEAIPEESSGGVSRRNFIAGGIATLLGVLGLSALTGVKPGIAANPQAPLAQDGHDEHDTGHGNSMMVGTVDHERNGFDPLRMLTDWDYGTVSTLPGGQTLRTY